MTRKDRMLKAIRGESLDRIPWCPRLDLWFNANKRNNTLPPRYAGATLRDLVDDLGFSYHAIVPDFKRLRTVEDEIHRALGIYNLECMPCRTVIANVDVNHEQKGDILEVCYRTPAGNLKTAVVYDENMRRAGITISHISEHAFKSLADYKALAYLFDNAVVEPNYEGYSAFAQHVGDRGVAAGFISLAGGPMHLVLRELMTFEMLCYEMFDHPDELSVLSESIGRYFRKVFAVAADSPAELFLFGANYDASLTNTKFFAEHITPWLREFGAMLHARGKLLLTHTDGENTGLLDCYLDAGIDVADSICPKPMTSLSFGDVRRHFADRIAILGGIPSVALVRESMRDADFERYIDEFLGDMAGRRKLMLGISDTTPPAAPLSRLIELGRRVAALGPVI